MPQDISTVSVNKSPRQSNIEALRLLCMLMILNLHSFGGYAHGSGFLQGLDFFRETTSICAVNTFLLISGYFGIRWKFKSFFNLIFQIAFYGFGVYLVAAALGLIDFSWMGFLSNIKCFTSFWGFVTGYLLLYIFSPFLNDFVDRSASRTVLYTILVLFLCEHFILKDSGFFNYGIIYLIGRFLNKANVVEKSKINSHYAYWICTLVIFALVFLLFKFGNVTTAEAMTVHPMGYSYASPLVILQAIFLFLIFAKMEFQSKFINWCSASCFAIFLIHMHPSIKCIGYYAYSGSLYDQPVWKHVICLAILFIGVFSGSILIDKIRIFLSDLCYKLLIAIKNIMPNKFTDFGNRLDSSIKELIK